uniref:C3H1-type domain-containing protein n=1 Tax=Pyrodinium bahamense TaxID=73915 RepID=A0A7S0FNF8_9DINO
MSHPCGAEAAEARQQVAALRERVMRAATPADIASIWGEVEQLRAVRHDLGVHAATDQFLACSTPAPLPPLPVALSTALVPPPLPAPAFPAPTAFDCKFGASAPPPLEAPVVTAEALAALGAARKSGGRRCGGGGSVPPRSRSTSAGASPPTGFSRGHSGSADDHGGGSGAETPSELLWPDTSALLEEDASEVATDLPQIQVLRLADALEESLPSVGSSGHYVGTCKPCAFVHTKGCNNGQDCKFCHICAPGSAKRRKKALRTHMRRGTESAALWDGAGMMVTGLAAFAPLPRAR